MTTDCASTFDGSAKNPIGCDMFIKAAQQVCEQSDLGPADFQVIELHNIGLGSAAVVTAYQRADR